MRSALESGWRFIDNKKETYFLPESLERATLVFRGDGVTRFRIFERILTSALPNDRLASIRPETWQYQSGKFFKVSLRCIDMSFANYCSV